MSSIFFFPLHSNQRNHPQEHTWGYILANLHFFLSFEKLHREEIQTFYLDLKYSDLSGFLPISALLYHRRLLYIVTVRCCVGLNWYRMLLSS